MNQDVLTIRGTKRWHDKGYTGKGVTVAVLDDFATTDIIRQYDANLDSTHGLNVCKSGLVNAPDANIIMLKFKGKGSDKQKCIDWIKANNPDLINVSLAGTYIQSKEFEQLEGFPLICATGNDGANEPLYPAKFYFALKVGSYDHYLNRIASYSNRGHDILGLNPYIQNNRGEWWRPAGTSFATPFVVGQLACYVQFLKEQGIEPTPQMLYDYAKTHKADTGLFVLPEPRLEVDTMGINAPEKIIIHHSLTEDNVMLSSFDAIRRYHMQTNGWSDIGYHWLLEKVNNKWIWRPGRPEKVSGAHTKEQGMNYKSIGTLRSGEL